MTIKCDELHNVTLSHTYLSLSLSRSRSRSCSLSPTLLFPPTLSLSLSRSLFGARTLWQAGGSSQVRRTSARGQGPAHGDGGRWYHWRR